MIYGMSHFIYCIFPTLLLAFSSRLFNPQHQNRWYFPYKISFVLWMERKWRFSKNKETFQTQGECTDMNYCNFYSTLSRTFLTCDSSLTTPNGFSTKNSTTMMIFWSKRQRLCFRGEIRREGEFISVECVSFEILLEGISEKRRAKGHFLISWWNLRIYSKKAQNSITRHQCCFYQA